MCANEVIANVALEKMGHPLGSYDIVEPHDDLNMSQSTNDFYPTALKVAMLRYNEPLLEELAALAAAFEAKGEEFAEVLKMGRTELQDAVPMTLGQEFHGFGSTLPAPTWRSCAGNGRPSTSRTMPTARLGERQSEASCGP